MDIMSEEERAGPRDIGKPAGSLSISISGSSTPAPAGSSMAFLSYISRKGSMWWGSGSVKCLAARVSLQWPCDDGILTDDNFMNRQFRTWLLYHSKFNYRMGVNFTRIENFKYHSATPSVNKGFVSRVGTWVQVMFCWTARRVHLWCRWITKLPRQTPSRKGWVFSWGRQVMIYVQWGAISAYLAVRGNTLGPFFQAGQWCSLSREVLVRRIWKRVVSIPQSIQGTVSVLELLL